MSSVAYHGVSKRFEGTHEALADFDLQVRDGEFMVLVGPSGCGKSTALRLLAGLEAVTAGEIRIDDEVVNDLSPQQRNIAMVFQNYALYPHMSVRDNLAFPLKMAKLSRAEIGRRVEEAARLLDMHDWLTHKPHQLSGGQRQRVAMGRAIVRDPRVFLMDEPLSNLDARLRVQIRSEIAALQKRMGTTTLYVTHDQLEAMSLGHRVAVLHAGRLQQVAEPQELYERPVNTFVAQFIGTPGMNLFPVVLQRRGDQLTLLLGEQVLVFPGKLRADQSRLMRYLDQPLLAGLRPEAIWISAGEQALPVHISGVETLGHEQLVYFTASWSEGQTLVARVTKPFHIDQQVVPVVLDTRQFYFFTQDGAAIY